MKVARDLVMQEVRSAIHPESSIVCVFDIVPLPFCNVMLNSSGVCVQVRRHFRPELLNRLDEIVIFDPLSHEQLRKVARLQM